MGRLGSTCALERRAWWGRQRRGWMGWRHVQDTGFEKGEPASALTCSRRLEKRETQYGVQSQRPPLEGENSSLSPQMIGTGETSPRIRGRSRDARGAINWWVSDMFSSLLRHNRGLGVNDRRLATPNVCNTSNSPNSNTNFLTSARPVPFPLPLLSKHSHCRHIATFPASSSNLPSLCSLPWLKFQHQT